MTLLPGALREEVPEPIERSVVEDEPAVALRGSSTILGIHFLSVGAGALSIGATEPLAGKVQLSGLWLQVLALPVVEDPHRFQIVLSSTLPTDQAGLDGGEQVFPRGSNQSESKNTLLYLGGTSGIFIPVSSLLLMNTRRLVCGWTNGGTITADGYLGFVAHRVIGGVGGGDPHFLLSQEVESR